MIFAKTSLKICVDLRVFKATWGATTYVGEVCSIHEAYSQNSKLSSSYLIIAKISLQICSYLIFARTSLKICVDLRDFWNYMRATTYVGGMCTTHEAWSQSSKLSSSCFIIAKISLQICSYLIFARTSLKICVDLRDFWSYMRATTYVGGMCTIHEAWSQRNLKA